MNITVAKTRLLLVLFAILAAAAATLTLGLADDAPNEDVLVPVNNTATAPVDDADEQSNAERNLRTNALVQSVVGTSAFTVTFRGPATRLESAKDPAPREIGVGIDVTLEKPVSSAGPWSILRCRGTRQVSSDMPFREVRHITGVISHDGELLEFFPEAADETEAIADIAYATTWQITDLLTGKVLWRSKPGQPIADGGLEFMECPAGFNDD